MYKISRFSKQKIRMREINKIKKIVINILIYLILIPILILNVTLIIQSIINPTKIPNILGNKVLIIISHSMEPEIKVGDGVVIGNIKKETDIKIGDIISFYSNNYLITHRVVNIEEVSQKLYFTTKGDNNLENDVGRISFQSVEGKVIIRLKRFENVIKTLQSPLTLMLIVIGLILNLLYSFKINKIKEIRKKKRIEYENKEKNNI